MRLNGLNKSKKSIVEFDQKRWLLTIRRWNLWRIRLTIYPTYITDCTIVDFHGKNCSIILQYGAHVFHFRSCSIRMVFELVRTHTSCSIAMLCYMFLSSKENRNLTIWCLLPCAGRWLRLEILNSSLRWWVSLKNTFKGMHSICIISLLLMTGNNHSPENWWYCQ